MLKPLTVLLPVLLGLSAAGAAQPLPGVSFSHHDWELACDNTRTCRAAGYHRDGQSLGVSVLLTRRAGPHTPVSAELQLGSVDNEGGEMQFPARVTLTMRIDGKNLGTLLLKRDTLTTTLSESQTAALLAALSRTSRIEWVAGGRSWRLSDRGAAAVLLKMDEFQGRVGTPGALLRRGKRHENEVLPPLPAPVLRAPAPVAARADDGQFLHQHGATLRRLILAQAVVQEECSALMEPDAALELSINRLSDQHLLLSVACWSAAYNAGDAYWVINDRPPFKLQLVTTSGNDYQAGQISAVHKGRGLGDCVGSDTWTWDGRAFVHTESSSSGLCKGIAAGGAWELPLLLIPVQTTPAR